MAKLVWSRLGDVDNYIEPFFGSGAVLLRRPTPPRIETVNDLDCHLANFWRAVKADPEAVAGWADGPVNEVDLHARHRWLVLGAGAAEFRERVRSDPDYYDPKRAGWWCWGACCWIGSGWCQASHAEVKQLPDVTTPRSLGKGVHGGGLAAQLPSIGDRPEAMGCLARPPGPPAKMPRAPQANGNLTGGNYSGALAASNATLPDRPRRGPDRKRPALGSPRSAGDSPGAPGHGVHAGGPRLSEQLPRLTGNYKSGGVGVHVDAVPGPPAQLPRLNGDYDHGGTGVHIDAVPDEKRPHLSQQRSRGHGIHGLGPDSLSDGNRPQLADAYSRGRGVHGNDFAGTCAARRAWLVDWFGRLADRLRTVRVCCGHWERVCGSPSVTTRLGLTGIFLDPPYRHALADGTANRAGGLYAHDDARGADALVDGVIAYCVARGSDPKLRIAVCGYAGEGYEVLEPLGWTPFAWKSAGGYGNRSAAGKGNAARERIWYSPNCLRPGWDLPLFPEAGDLDESEADECQATTG